MRYSLGAPSHDEAAIRVLRECRDGTLDLTSVPHVNRTQLHTNRRRDSLDSGGRNGRIAKNRHSRYAGGDLLEQLQSFPAHRIFVDCKTGDVTARPCQALNITSTNRIDDSRKHYRNGGAFHFVCVQVPSYRFLSLVRCSEMKLLFVEKCPCSDPSSS